MSHNFQKTRRISWHRKISILFVSFVCIDHVQAQSVLPDWTLPNSAPEQFYVTTPPSADLLPHEDFREERAVQLRTWGIILGSAAAVGLYGQQKWWQDGFESSFKRQDEGWFGQNTYSGGADKLGHFFMNYVGTRLSSSAFEWAGNTPEDSLKLAALTTLGIMTGVEILDGFSKNWNFSKEDAIVNALGAGTAVLMEKNPQLDRLLDIRLLYWPSREGGREFNPFGDYSGQTYLLVAKANGLPALREHPVLRYLEVAVGYGTRGYSDSPREDSANPQRHVYFGLSLNVAEVLRRSVFKQSESGNKTQRVSEAFLEFVQVPGTAGLFRQNLNED